MLDSNSQRFLSGIVLAACAFGVFWFVFYALITICIVFVNGIDLFRPHPYLQAIDVGGSTVLAALLSRKIARRITSRPQPSMSHKN